MMPSFAPGDVWQVDLGYAAKVRPCLILSRYPADDELALVVFIPHTTAVRQNRWECRATAPFLTPGVFHLQQIQPVSLPRLMRRLGRLGDADFRNLRQKLVAELELIPANP
jgi:mRNA interferase MazF